MLNGIAYLHNSIITPPIPPRHTVATDGEVGEAECSLPTSGGRNTECHSNGLSGIRGQIHRPSILQIGLVGIIVPSGNGVQREAVVGADKDIIVYLRPTTLGIIPTHLQSHSVIGQLQRRRDKPLADSARNSS